MGKKGSNPPPPEGLKRPTPPAPPPPKRPELNEFSEALVSSLCRVFGEPEGLGLKRRRDFYLREAEKAAHEYAVSLELGDERIAAFEIFENIRTAGRVY